VEAAMVAVVEHHTEEVQLMEVVVATEEVAMATPVVPVVPRPGGNRSTAFGREATLPSLFATIFPFHFDICTLGA